MYDTNAAKEVEGSRQKLPPLQFPPPHKTNKQTNEQHKKRKNNAKSRKYWSETYEVSDKMLKEK